MLKRVLGGKTTPPSIFFRPILPNFEEIFEIVVGDFERWPMLPVRKTAVDGKMYVVKSKVGPVCLFCVMVWLVLVYGKILGQLEKSTLPTLFPLRRLEGE